jgi:hypothetical protein
MNTKSKFMGSRIWGALLSLSLIFAFVLSASAQVVTKTKTVVTKGAVKTAHGTRKGYRVTKTKTVVVARKSNRGLHKGWYKGKRVGQRTWVGTKRVSGKGWHGTKRVTKKVVKKVY